MPDDSGGDIATLNVNPNVPRDPVTDVQEKIDQIWRHLATTPEVVARLGTVDPDAAPLTVGTRDARVGIVEAIIVSAVAGLSRDVATWLWKEKIWPLLKRETGDDLTEG